MTISEDNLKRWFENTITISDLCESTGIFTKDAINLYKSYNVPADEKYNAIAKEAISKINELYELSEIRFKVEEELDNNLPFLSNNVQMSHYLDKILKRNTEAIERLEDAIQFNFIQESEIPLAVLGNTEMNFSAAYLRAVVKNQPLILIDMCVGILMDYYHFNKYLQEKKIAILSPASDVIEDEIQSNSEGLTAVSHRLILLNRLGVFEKLFKDHYNNIGPGQFVLLIANIIGVEPSKASNQRATINRYIDEVITKTGKSDKPVENPGSLKAVNTFLASIGMIKSL